MSWQSVRQTTRVRRVRAMRYVFLASVAVGLMVGMALGTGYLSFLAGTLTAVTANVQVSGCTQPAASGWSGEVPPSRMGAAIAYDPSATSGMALMFGGSTTTNVQGDTWEYNAGCWKEVTTSVSFAPTGTVQTWVVPSGINSITVDMAGAAGEPGDDSDHTGLTGTVGSGGDGGRVMTSITVTAGSTLDIYAGGMSTTVGTGGYPGGGAGGSCSTNYGDGGNGGGYSEIETSGGTIYAVAGGGGGGGGIFGDNTEKPVGGNGGYGGNPGSNGGTGTSGYLSESDGGGTGATSVGVGTGGTGQAANGASGSGQNGGAGGEAACHLLDPGGGGGGGGYHGGGGGGDGVYSSGGGGGGDSYCPNNCVLPVIVAGYEGGNGYVKISYVVPNAGYSGGEIPMPRFGASMVWDAAASVFVLYGGCDSEVYSTSTGFFPDLCSDYNVLSDLWYFSPTSGTWAENSGATCTNGLPYSNTPALTYSVATAQPSSCQYTYTSSVGLTGYCSDLHGTGTTVNYCYSYGVYGGSMVYDPDTTQCGTSQGCVLLYGGATWASSANTLTPHVYWGPCDNYLDDESTGHQSGDYCSDYLWMLSGSSGSTLAWTLENDAVISLGTGTTSASDNGLAWSSLTVEPTCSAANGCTVVLTGGVEQSSTSPYETTVASEWYLTGTVGSAWVSGNALPAAAEGASEVFDQNSADSSLNGHVVNWGGMTSNGDGYTSNTVTGVYRMSVTPGSAPGTWSTYTLPSPSPAPDDLQEAGAFCDSAGNGYVIAAGGWDGDLYGVSGDEGPNLVFILN